MIGTKYYKLWGRPPKKDGLYLIKEFAEKEWQFALKYKEIFKKKGFKNLLLQELLITDES